MSRDMRLDQTLIGQEHELPLNPLPEISRRGFIKLLEAALDDDIAGGADAEAVGRPELADLPPLTHVPRAAAELLAQAFAELRSLGIPISLERALVVTAPHHPQLVGVLLCDDSVPPHTRGANIALTIDLDSPERSVLTYVVGQSLVEALRLKTTVLTPIAPRATRYQLLSRCGIELAHDQPIGLMREQPLLTHQVTRQDDASAGGAWREHTNWYYDHCGDATWAPRRDHAGLTLHLRYGNAREYRNCRDSAAAPSLRTQRATSGWYSESRTVDLCEEHAHMRI